MAKWQCVLIIVENLPMPFDRRVWQESCALRDAGYKVVVISPRMRGYTAPYELLDGIHIYRHWISHEARGAGGFLAEYASALVGRGRPGMADLAPAPPIRHSPVQSARPALSHGASLQDPGGSESRLRRARPLARDVCREVRPARTMYWVVRMAERATLALADVVLATNESVRSIAARRGRKQSADVIVVRTAPSELDTSYRARTRPCEAASGSWSATWA